MAATGWNVEQAIQSVTAVPARILGLPDRGRLAVGARGDLVLLGAGLEVVATVIGGDVVHGSEALSWR
jgi:N-acetylglucosamine-6-phosphate deacetylase